MRKKTLFLLVVFYCTDQSITRAGTEMLKATKPWLGTILVYFQFSFCQRKNIKIEPTLQESIQTIPNMEWVTLRLRVKIWPQKKLLSLETSCHFTVGPRQVSRVSQLWTCNLAQIHVGIWMGFDQQRYESRCWSHKKSQSSPKKTAPLSRKLPWKNPAKFLPHANVTRRVAATLGKGRCFLPCAFLFRVLRRVVARPPNPHLPLPGQTTQNDVKSFKLVFCTVDGAEIR